MAVTKVTEPTTTTEGPPAPAPAFTPSTIVQALADVSAAVGSVGKDSTAPAKIGGYAFRGIDAVVNACAGPLRDHGVVVIPEVLAVERVTTQARSGGGGMMNVYVTTRFTFHGPAGDSLACTVLGEAADAGDKATSKAQSVALRVALLQVLMLPTDEPDPDTQNYEREATQPTQGRTQAAAQRQPNVQAAVAPETHVARFWDTFGSLTHDQQTWVRNNWPQGYPDDPNRMTVAQAAVALELLGTVPPA